MTEDPLLLEPSLPRTNERRLLEQAKSLKSMHYVLGVDEAGRGPLAGPVVAAAFLICPVSLNKMPVLPKSLSLGITDSKQVKEDVREHLYFNKIKPCKGVKYSVAVVGNKVIDEINILQATFVAMTEAVDSLISEISYSDPHASFSVLIDGNKVPPQLKERKNISICEALIKGDSIEFLIAAASICSKVERDHIMLGLDAQFPMYGFKQHKGYPTGGHVAAISVHGPCEHHRMTFAPLKHNIKKMPSKKREANVVSARDERAKRRLLRI